MSAEPATYSNIISKSSRENTVVTGFICLKLAGEIG